MPYREADPTDPTMLVGTAVDCTADELQEMAASFASELVQIGHDAERIMSYFRRPFYAGPHLAWRKLGEQRTRRIVDESVRFWSHCRFVVTEPAAQAAGPAEDRARPCGEAPSASRLLSIGTSGADGSGRT